MGSNLIRKGQMQGKRKRERWSKNIAAPALATSQADKRLIFASPLLSADKRGMLSLQLICHSSLAKVVQTHHRYRSSGVIQLNRRKFYSSKLLPYHAFLCSIEIHKVFEVKQTRDQTSGSRSLGNKRP
ncbi:hypothetical protein H5410_054989 [Solanum commersonii]|uniref:Uncharacterized protein n=1 Tax=Solanum commersonii TaxID=4109 RepID=A0A9J5WHP6_SOLCO|nr:hypothetical protein H5410_054989 [Solanum commersonii]